MHQTSPGVERAVAAARNWAERLGSDTVTLAHYVLALLDEEEGRPAVLLEQLGISIPRVREQLLAAETQPAPPVATLFNAARSWSLRHRHDPELLTDSFLLAVINADAAFRAAAAELGLSPEILERKLVTATTSHEEPESPGAAFAIPEVKAEVDAARVLDANFNRAREASRVLEDYCRFVLEDRWLTEQVKLLRHELAESARQLPENMYLTARDTLRDVGTNTTAAGEYERTSPAHVAAVNLKRLQESLRSLEEYSKVFSVQLGRRLESLRYRTYTIERALILGGAARSRLAAARLYVMLTRASCVASLDWTIREAAAGGADMFQLREKSISDREFLNLAREVRRWTRESGTLFVVNDRPDIARLAEADGVHLGQDDMCVKDARRIVGPDSIIGISTHTIEQLREAILDGADYVGIGPVFPSKTKDFTLFPGLPFIQSATEETSLPAFALGGIDTRNVGQVVEAGARRIAVSAAICSASDPEQSARLLKNALS